MSMSVATGNQQTWCASSKVAALTEELSVERKSKFRSQKPLNATENAAVSHRNTRVILNQIKIKVDKRK